jgi:hypothetical protein
MKSITAAAFAAIAFAVPASAATVNVLGTVGNGTAYTNPAPDVATGAYNLDVTGTVPNQYKDIYADTNLAGKSPFNVVKNNDPDPSLDAGALTYNLAGAANSFFRLIWGSIDDSNKLTIVYDDDSTEDVFGSDVLAADPTLTYATSNAYVKITVGNKSFKSVKLTSGVNSFEHAFNPVPAPVPVPAAGLLLVAALGGLGVVARRRKAV